MAEPLPIPTPAQMATMRALLVPLGRVSALFFVLGIIFAVDAFTRALFGTAAGTVGWIPFVGRLVTAPIHRIEQKVSSYLGGLESHIDASMGGYIHALAIAVGQLASGEAEAGWGQWLIAKVVHATRVAVDALPSIGTVTKTKTIVVKQTKVIVKRVVHVEKIARHSVSVDAIPRLRVVEGELEDLLRTDIPSLRHRAKWIEGRLIKLGEYIHRNAINAATLTATGAVAIALARLGAGWLRCSSVQRIGKRLGCRGFGLLETLLAATIEVLLIADVCQITKLMIRVAESKPVREALSGIIAATDELLLCQGVERAPDMEFHAVALPPAQRWATLPG